MEVGLVLEINIKGGGHMIIAKIWGFPLTEEIRLNELYEEIKKEISTDEVTGVLDLTQTILTIGEDKKEVRIGEEIVFEIFEKSGQVEVVSLQLATIFQKVVCTAFPKVHIEWYIFYVNLDQAYWPSPCDDGNSFALGESIYD